MFHNPLMLNQTPQFSMTTANANNPTSRTTTALQGLMPYPSPSTMATNSTTGLTGGSGSGSNLIGTINATGTTTTSMIPTASTTSMTGGVFGDLDTLRAKLEMAEQQILSVPNKNAQSIIPLTFGEIRILQKVFDTKSLQGVTGNSTMVSPSFPSNLSASNASGGQYNGSIPPTNYVCHKCGVQGHYIHNCPNVKTKTNTNSSVMKPPPENYICHKCNIQGHWVQQCPLRNQEYGNSPPLGYCCHRCGISGHWIKDCPTNNYDYNQNSRDLSSNNYSSSSNPKKFTSQKKQQQQFNTNHFSKNSRNDQISDNDLNSGIAITQNSNFTKKKRHPNDF